MKRFFTAFTLIVFLAGSALGRTPQVSDYLGKWAIVICNSNDTFRSCSLTLHEAEGGALLGEMVWRWGSVWVINKPGIITLDKKTGDLLIRRRGWDGPLVFRLVGDVIEGKVTIKNDTFYLTGSREWECVDINGMWDITITYGEREAKGSMKLT